MKGLLDKANAKIAALEKAHKGKSGVGALKVENEKLKKKLGEAQKQQQAPIAGKLRGFLKSSTGTALMKAYTETTNLKVGIRKQDTREALFKIDAVFNELQEATAHTSFEKENEDSLGVLLSSFEKVTKAVHSGSWKEAEKASLRA